MREATIHLSGEELAALGIGEFVSAIHRADLEQVTELQCRRPGCLLAVQVAEPIPPDRLADLDNLEWWEQLAPARGVTSLCKLAVPAFDEALAPSHETEVSERDVETAGDPAEHARRRFAEWLPGWCGVSRRRHPG